MCCSSLCGFSLRTSKATLMPDVARSAQVRTGCKLSAPQPVHQAANRLKRLKIVRVQQLGLWMVGSTKNVLRSHRDGEQKPGDL